MVNATSVLKMIMSKQIYLKFVHQITKKKNKKKNQPLNITSEKWVTKSAKKTINYLILSEQKKKKKKTTGTSHVRKNSFFFVYCIRNTIFMLLIHKTQEHLSMIYMGQ